MRKTSIRARLLIMMICLTTLPVLILTVIAAANTRNSIETEIINANTSRMMWADQYLNELTEQLSNLFYTLQINRQLMDNLSNVESTDVGVQYQAQSYTRETLSSMFFTYSRKIDSLTLYIHANSKAYQVDFINSGLPYPLDIKDSIWNRILGTPVSMYFKQSGSSIHAFHGMYRFEDRKLIGGLSVRINASVWQEVGDILRSEPDSSVFLINDEGELLSGSTSEEDSGLFLSQFLEQYRPSSPLQVVRTKSSLCFIKQVGNGRLTIVKAIPYETISRSAQPTIAAGILTGCLFTAVSILLSILVSLRISRPIVNLARTMRKAHIDDFELKSPRNHDEIGLLESAYNTMMQRIKDLIEDRYHKEIAVKTAQIKALQAQINPHFLNNTLQLIGGMALASNVPDIYQITRIIGELLRYSISSGGDMVSLEDELKHTENYLFIQEKRFTGRCAVTVSVQQGVLGCRVPRFILQPVVENAFEHGLQQKEGHWRLSVSVKRIGSRVAIMVRDNGAGIGEERLRQVREQLKEGVPADDGREHDGNARKARGIGLRNVNARLKLQFGKEYGARIFSKAGAGALVVLSFPISESGVDANVPAIDH